MSPLSSSSKRASVDKSASPALRDFDIDYYLNPFVPRPRLYLLPRPISWFLGYRKTPRKPVGSLLVHLWSFLGAFVGIAIVEAVFMTRYFEVRGTPVVIASFGAAAILNFSAISSPLAQPRNAILGQTLASIVGVCITKLFERSASFASLRWLAGALSVATTSAVMGLTGTVFPPAGATALLCSTTAEITALGWFFIPLVLLGSVLLVATACVVNNLQRTYPLHWWTGADLGGGEKVNDEEKQKVEEEKEKEKEEREKEKKETEEMDEKVGRGVGQRVQRQVGRTGDVVITAEGIEIPVWLELGDEQREVLEVLRNRLRDLGRERSRESEWTQVGDVKDVEARS